MVMRICSTFRVWRLPESAFSNAIFFDGSIELSVQTLSQGSAGDTAISASVTQTLTVLSEGDGVDLKVGSATGIEDSPVPVRLPISERVRMLAKRLSLFV